MEVDRNTENLYLHVYQPNGGKEERLGGAGGGGRIFDYSYFFSCELGIWTFLFSAILFLSVRFCSSP